MKLRISMALFIFCLFLTKVSAQEIQVDSLDHFIHQLMEDFEVTGLSVGIVQNDSIVYSKGFGLRQSGKPDRVDDQTLFGIGSISKSFTALTLGLLVDEGKIDWDDRVVEYLPYFELYDPYVTEHFTIRDLLTHHSGLKDVSGGTLWYHSDYSRVEIIKRLKHLKPISGFREKPAYQNTMFVVAGEIVSEVAGISWDDFLKERILDKIDMSNTTSVSEVREASSNIARPHIWDENFQKTAIIQERGDNLAAAGFIYSSAHEMINYMRLLLNGGDFEGDSLVSTEVIEEIFKPQVLFQISSPPFGNEFTSYGLGWWLTPRNGHKIIEHSGGIDGMSAQLFMVKDLDIGVVILTNVSKEPASFLLKAKLLEWILKDDSYDIYELGKAFRKRRFENIKESINNRLRIEETKPSLALADYAGVYTDEMYGDIIISQSKDDDLEISFSHTPLFSGKLIHWHYDTFKIDWHDMRVPDGFLIFNFDATHQVKGFTIEQENLLDVDFGELDIIKKKTD